MAILESLPWHQLKVQATWHADCTIFQKTSGGYSEKMEALKSFHSGMNVEHPSKAFWISKQAGTTFSVPLVRNYMGPTTCRSVIIISSDSVMI